MVDTDRETTMTDYGKYRNDFPALQQTVHGKPLVYLDSAASSQKPQVVLDTINDVYSRSYSNVHRGVHALSERATQAYEASRTTVKQFINAESEKEIIFVRGATEAINLIAHSYVKPRLRPGDEIIISELEHHANIVPWQIICDLTEANLRVIPIDQNGDVVYSEYQQAFNDRTKFVSISYISNALGTINPIQEFIQIAHSHNVPILVDGAQAVPHLSVDMQALDCDFFVFSGHKVYGPSGTGVLYGKQAMLEVMPPYQAGGDMILKVTFAKTTYNQLPYKFEAGTPNIEGAIGLAAALDYLQGIGMQRIADHEQKLLAYATERLLTVPGLQIIGNARHKAAVISFILDGIHAHDIGTILDREGIAIRTGHHCAMPTIDHFGLAATARASFALYNTLRDVDRLVAGLQQVRKVFDA